MIVSRDERGFLHPFPRVMQLALRLPFLNAVEQIDNFLRCLLDESDQVGLLESAIHDDSGYFRAEFFVLFTGLGKVSDAAPKFSSVLEVDEELGDVRVRAFESIAKDFS